MRGYVVGILNHGNKVVNVSVGVTRTIQAITDRDGGGDCNDIRIQPQSTKNR